MNQVDVSLGQRSILVNYITPEVEAGLDYLTSGGPACPNNARLPYYIFKVRDLHSSQHHGGSYTAPSHVRLMIP